MNNKNNFLINTTNILQYMKCDNKNEDVYKNVFIKKIVSYKLLSKSNDKYCISNVIYIGNNYFITILKKQDYEFIYNLKSNYYIKKDLEQLSLISINPFVNIIENNFIISLIQISNENNLSFFKFEVINPSMYLLYEQNDIELSYEVNDSLILNNKIISISENYLEIEEKNKLKIGSPLFYDNILIGIHYRDNKNVGFFYRLSKLYIWLNSYSIFTNYEIPKKLYVLYSKEELFNIIICLNDKINSLEKKVDELIKN